MRIHGKLVRSTVNGPGGRAVIFFQGCSLGCLGCHNPGTHDPRAGTEMEINELADWILRIPDIAGVTFSGGEPMEQLFDGLLGVARRLRTRRPWISIGMFTGYTQGELDAGKFRATQTDRILQDWDKRELWGRLTTLIDWAVMGRYNRLEPCNEPLRSSRNQEIVHFSGRDLNLEFPSQALELTISEDGELAQITGFPQGICETVKT